MKFLLLESRLEKENLDFWSLSVENEALLTCNFHLIVVLIFLKTCVKDRRGSSA